VHYLAKQETRKLYIFT